MSEGLRREFARAFDRFWMQPYDLRILDVIRRLYGLLMLIYVWLFWVDRHLLFGRDSWLPVDAANGVVDPDTYNLYTFFPDHPLTITVALFALWVCGGMMIVGLLPRLAAFLTLILLTWVHHANILLVDAEDTVFRLFAFFLMFTPPWKQLKNSFVSERDEGTGEQVQWRFPAWPIRLFQLQLCIIYFCSAIQKTNGPEWLDGTALYYALRLDDLTHFHLPWLMTESLGWSKFICWFVLAFELAIPIMVWRPRFRKPCLVILLLFHMGTDYSINLHMFHWIMIVGLLSFVRYDEYQNYLRFVLHRKSQETAA